MSDNVPSGTPPEVQQQVSGEPRVPCFDPTVGVPLAPASGPTPTNRLVVIGDSTHMTLYSDRSLLAQAADAATEWFAQHLLPLGAATG